MGNGKKIIDGLNEALEHSKEGSPAATAALEALKQYGNVHGVLTESDRELFRNATATIEAALSQPAKAVGSAATVQEAIDFKYWLMDAARILRSNGTDTHASWVEKALAALSPSKAVEPAPVGEIVQVNPKNPLAGAVRWTTGGQPPVGTLLYAHPSPAPQQPQI